MRITPVLNNRKPAYPTRTILDEHPELLKLVPKRWSANPIVLTALTAVCLLMSGYRARADGEVKSRVAPIFYYGGGRGSFGCIAMNPPVFLSEEEARQVIEFEMKSAGFKIIPDSLTIGNVNCPLTDPFEFLRTDTSYPRTDSPLTEDECRRIPLKLDGTDAKRGVSYEYVSQQDFEQWDGQKRVIKGWGRFGWCSVSELDMLGTAQQLREKLVPAKARGAFGVFYDPCISSYADEYNAWSLSLPKTEPVDPFDQRRSQLIRQARPREMAADELREQVRDFIKWLKAQGVI